jgi:hypothetical protein
MSVLTEEQGCAVLRRVFQTRGYQIQTNFPFHAGNVAFHVDGWDPAYRVGYEFITKGAGDHEDLPPEAMAQLSEWMTEGRLALFMIDQADVHSETDLEWAANRFLDDLASRSKGG